MNDLHERYEAEDVFQLNVLLPERAWHGYAKETVWAKALEPLRMQILNTPFFAKGLSYGDIASISVRADGLWLEEVVVDSTHSTYRILINDATKEIHEYDLWSKLKDLGCTYESFISGSFALYAVDIPQQAVREAFALLSKGEKDGTWDFDEGKYVAPS